MPEKFPFPTTANGRDLRFKESLKALDLKQLATKLESQVFQKNSYKETDLESLARLVYALRENITTYDSVISDESSARLPSLILWKIINKKRKAEGKKAIRLYFLSGARFRESREVKTKPLLDFLKAHKKEIGTHTLLSTEYISSGRTVQFFGDILKRSNVAYTVASVSVSPMFLPLSFYKGKTSENNFFKGIAYGKSSSKDPKVTGSNANGVIKFPRDPSPHPRLPYSTGWVEDREQVVLARKDIRHIVDALYKLL
ncbi:hypothetical protein COU15_00895 [Candidatus Kaiserbacteria bacterium CG10_big_fil_rev_8_21_14_0_10_45_20]|uniref:Uncharacterized protein n=1 Tax=Candidatus Kaiserbacteria bacterium CG10_big_fil_rev_8_21_14_0_10_45_20 TaxID=1974607 RepID=A0A2H0UG29_9BACT|nr:MAG: hypothetical protein COU15_00895 [Candidatus Kaiserbacteria bacterium CG10_big_fil_rev_8_21_14_0_10_45_20]